MKLTRTKNSIILVIPYMFPKTASLRESAKTGMGYLRSPWTHKQGFHPGHFQDNAVEPQQLENSQPRVRFRIPHGGDLDDGGTDGQNKVQPVPPFPEEVSPVREVSCESDDNLDVECDSDRELSVVEELSVHWPWVDRTSGLYGQRDESQNDPEPLGHLVVVLEFIPSGGYQATVDNPEILVMFSVDVDNQAGEESLTRAQARLQWRRELTEPRQMHSFVFLS